MKIERAGVHRGNNRPKLFTKAFHSCKAGL
jgi:hypothetical protein